MPRSQEALARRAAKRGRTVEEQRAIDNKTANSETETAATTPTPPPVNKVDATISQETIVTSMGPVQKKQKREKEGPLTLNNAALGEQPEAQQVQEKLTLSGTAVANDDDMAKALEEKGAWTCPKCGNHNYASRRVCHSKTCDQQCPPNRGQHTRASRKPLKSQPLLPKLKWPQQAGPERIIYNMELRARYKSNRESLDEQELERAEQLMKRDRRKREKRELQKKEREKKKAMKAAKLKEREARQAARAGTQSMRTTTVGR